MDAEADPQAVDLPHGLRELLAHIPEAAWLYDGRSLRFLDANDRALRRYGYTRDELLRLTLRDINPVDDLDRLEETARLPGEHWRVRARHQRRDGTRLWVDVSCYRLESPSDIWLAIVSEASETVEGHRRLEDLEARYGTLIEQLPAAVYLQEVSATTRIVYMSEYIEQLLGYPAEMSTADPNHWITCLHPDDRERVLAATVSAAGHDRTRPLEYRTITADGRVVWLRDDTSLIRDADGQPRYWHGMLFDITERRNAEDALARQAARLAALAEASRAFAGAALDIDAVLATVTAQVAAIFGEDACVVRLLSADGAALGTAATWCADSERGDQINAALDAIAQPVAAGLNGQVITSGRARHIVLDDPELVRDAVFPGYWELFERIDAGSLLIAPLRARERVIGTLTLIRQRGTSAYSDDELLLLENLADRAAMAIDNAQLFSTAQQAESRLAAALDAGLDVFLLLEALRDDTGAIVDFRFVHANPRAAGLVGLPHEQLVGATVREVYPAALVEGYLARYRAVVASGVVCEEEFEEHIPTWGGHVFVRHQLVPYSGGIAITVRDITERRRAELALRESEERFRSTFEDAPIGMAVIDLDGRFQRVNPALERWLGYDAASLTTMGPSPVTHPEDVATSRQQMAALCAGDIRGYQLERRFVTASGEVVWGLVTVGVVENEAGQPAYGLLQVQDISARRRLEGQLLHQALHDALTGLPNRTLLLDRLERALANTQRDGRLVAVLFIDLDNFKVINDSLGHRMGDALLVEIGSRLAAVVRESDTVSRFGGDEFVVLMPAIGDRTEAEQVARRIGALLAEPVEIDGRVLLARGSIGIALGGPHAETGEDLLRQADIAMYRAKARGKNRFDVFEAEMQAQVIQRLDMEHELRRAMDRGELVIHYQPTIGLQRGTVTGVEALVRWQHPERGLMPPMEFIPLAEETGLIVPLGEWVLREACREAAGLQRRRGAGSPVAIGVNLSARQFAQPDLAERVGAILDETGLAPRFLIVEITESVMMDDPERALRTLHALDERGVRLAIDDFGMGFSSLSRVREFPLHYLKIDRHFISDLGVDLGDTVVVSGIIGLAHALGVTVVAEGVETADQREHLRALDCDIAQGYHFARPMPLDDLLRWWEPFEAGASDPLVSLTDRSGAARLAPIHPLRRLRPSERLAQTGEG